MCEVKRRTPSQYSGLKIITLTNLDYGGVLTDTQSVFSPDRKGALALDP